MTYNAEKNLTPLYIGKKILRTFSVIFILLLAPEEGLLFFLKPKYWAVCVDKYIFCFILLFTSSSPCRKDQFAVAYFSTKNSYPN